MSVVKRKWILYVDESGKIPNHKLYKWEPDSCNVTGILVDMDRSLHVAEALEKQYKQLFPWVPWPFHHSELRKPLYHVAWMQAYRADNLLPKEQVLFSKEADSWSQNIAESLIQRMPQEWENFVDAARNSRKFPTSIFRRLQNEAFRAKGGYRRMHSFQTLLERRISSLDTVTSNNLKDYTEFLLSAGETVPGDCYRLTLDELAQKQREILGPWGQLFVSLVERVVQFLYSMEGEHYLEVRCASRDLWSGNGAYGVKMSMRSIEQLLSVLFGDEQIFAADDETHRTRVLVMAKQPVDYRVDADAFLIHADRAANELYAVMRDEHTLAEMQEHIRMRMPFVEFEASALPQIAAIGESAWWRFGDAQVAESKPNEALLNVRWQEAQAHLATQFLHAQNISWRGAHHER